MDQNRTGSFTATGAAVNISLGWHPSYVRAVNFTDGDTIHEWWYGMTAGTAIKTTTAVATLGTNGISTYAGTDALAEGFTLGTDVCENAKVIYWLAMRDGPGAQE